MIRPPGLDHLLDILAWNLFFDGAFGKGKEFLATVRLNCYAT